MKAHVAGIGLATAAAASVIAWRAATADSRDDRALPAWLLFANANTLHSAVRHYFRAGRPTPAAAAAPDGGAIAEGASGATAARGGDDPSTSAAAVTSDRDGAPRPPPPFAPAAAAHEAPSLPDDFVCPIGAFVMMDPVLCGCTPACGKSFDRRSIERWVTLGAGTCPHTGRQGGGEEGGGGLGT